MQNGFLRFGIQTLDGTKIKIDARRNNDAVKCLISQLFETDPLLGRVDFVDLIVGLDLYGKFFKSRCSHLGYSK